MNQSQFFTKTIKEAPKDEPSINARLLEQAGFVQKVLAGVYTFMPLGNRVLQKIENIVREEMNTIGAEVLMPSLQPKENWMVTGRWEGLDVLFKLKSQHGYDYALGPTHEEIIAPAAKKIIGSYRDLPAAAYQIQTKFRDEARVKSGLLRGREFRMKDLYSFHATTEDLDLYYSKVQQVYTRLFQRLGLKALLTEASGGSFSKYSHEYQVEVPTGEDLIFVCEKCELAKNKEIYSGPNEKCTNCGETTWRETKACEVGNIFKLSTKYSDPFGLQYVDADGKPQPVIMGCYGIGTTRLMGVIAELSNDDKGLIWPENVSPFGAHIIPLRSKDEEMQAKINKTVDQIKDHLESVKIDVLVDDRDETAGVKFADSDLMGIAHRFVISEKTLASDSVEWKRREQAEPSIIKISEVMKMGT